MRNWTGQHHSCSLDLPCSRACFKSYLVGTLAFLIEVSCHFLSPSRPVSGQRHNWATIVSFKMLSKSLFICYPCSRCYIFWLLEALLYNPQKNTYVMRGCVYSLYSSHDILRTMRWWRIWCRKHLTLMCERTNSQIFLFEIPEWKRPLKDPRTDGRLDSVAGCYCSYFQPKMSCQIVLQSILTCGYEPLTICKQQHICFSFMLMCSSLETLSVQTVKWRKE